MSRQEIKPLAFPARSKGGKRDFKKWIYDRRLYLLIFMIPVVIMYIVYAVFKVHPWGDNSVLVLDLNGQYVYYYEAMRDAFWGDGSFIYSWNRNLSGEMFGIYAYYLLSPFMLVICLLPRTMMCGAIEIMQLLKIGFAAVSFAFFARRSLKTKNLTSVIFSASYALMTYMVAELMDPMWLDGLIYLPLICLGVERLINKGRVLGLVIPLALMFTAHFYIGYMTGIFTFFYFLYYLFCGPKRLNASGALKSILKFAGSAVLAVMCAAAVILPVYKSLSLGKLEFSEPDFTLKGQFTIIEFFAKLFPMSYDTVRPEGLPMVFCGTLTLVMLPVFFLNKKINAKKKAGLGILAGILLLSMYIAPADIAWHGFQVPNWLPYRYSFALSFVLLVMAALTFNNLSGVTFKAVGGTVFGLFVSLIYYEQTDFDFFSTVGEKVLDDGTTANVPQGIWFSAIMIFIYFVLIFLMKKSNYKWTGALIALSVCVELYLVSLDTLNKVDADVGYSKYTSYEDYMTDMRNIVDDIQSADSSFYRMEKTFDRTVCDPIGMGYAGISHSSSTMNASALLMLKNLGYGYGGNYTCYNGSTYINDSFLNIKYLMTKTDELWSEFCSENISEAPVLYNKVRDFDVSDENNASEGTVSQYENPYALSIAFTADKRVLDLALDQNNPFENQNELFGAAASDNGETRYLKPLTYTVDETVNAESEGCGEDHVRYYNTAEEGSECHVDFLINVDSDGPVYVYFPTDFERECNIWYYDESEFEKYKSENGLEPEMNFGGTYFEGDNYGILNLGEFKAGQTIRMRVSIHSEVIWKDSLFYTIDRNAFESAVSQIKQGALDVTEYTGRSIKGTVDISSSDQVLLTTIPYEEGWNITVDGQKVEPLRAAQALIAIPVGEGSHEIAMEFMPSYFIAACIISFAGVLICAVIFILERRKKNEWQNQNSNYDK